MEISHASTQNQSITVGKVGAAHKVTVSTDAEFMMAVAHGIYSNKPLALVRELLCNARDGHFAKGTPDAFIDVTVTDNKLVVRDYGTGIPNDIFPVNYTTFGKSTKRKLMNQTGGFGVGSKVPWAVCDTFSARNFIEGMVTTYTIIKSDPKENGEPTCTPVVSVPTKEPTGIEVIVPFPEAMAGDIRKYVYAFAGELGLNIKMNGAKLSNTKVDTIRLKTLGYLPMTETLSTVTLMQPVMVRLGDVIYPVEMQKEYREAYDTVMHLQGPDVCCVILQAEPGSITPTMSRESLSYTDFSIASIKTLLINMLQHLATVIDDHAELVKAALPKAILDADGSVYSIWNRDYDYKSSLRRLNVSSDTVSAEAAMLLNHNIYRWLTKSRPYLETAQSSATEFRQVVDKAVEVGFKALLKHRYLHQESLYKIWSENKDALKPVIDEFIQDEIHFWKAELKAIPEIQDVWVPNNSNFRYYNEIPKSQLTGIRGIGKLKDISGREIPRFNVPWTQSIEKQIFGSRLVIIISSMARALDRFGHQAIQQYDLRKTVFSDNKGAFAGARIVKLATPHKTDLPAKLKAAYERDGYVVLDLTQLTPAEIEEREEQAAERAEERAKPLPTYHEMSESLITHSERKAFKNLKKNPKYKNKGKFYLLADRGMQIPTYLRYLRHVTTVSKLFGTDIICASTKPQIARVIKEGRVSLDTAFLKMAKAFFAKPGIHEKMVYRSANQMLSNALKDPRFAQLIYNRRIPHLSEDEEMTFKILNEYAPYFPSLGAYMEMKRKLYEKSSISRHYSKKEDSFGDLQFINFSEVNRWAFTKRPSEKRAIARTILKTVHRK